MSDFNVTRGPALWRVAPGYLTVASPDGSSVQMGGPAAAIWRLLPTDGANPVTVRALTTQLAADYDEPLTTVEAAAIEVLDALEALGCVVRFA